MYRHPVLLFCCAALLLASCSGRQSTPRGGAAASATPVPLIASPLPEMSGRHNSASSVKMQSTRGILLYRFIPAPFPQKPERCSCTGRAASRASSR